MDQTGPTLIEQTEVGQIRTNRLKWIEWDRSEPNGPNEPN